MGISISQELVIDVTASPHIRGENENQEAFMPILLVALLALAAFGVIGIVLGAAVMLEQRKIHGKHHGKAA